MFKKNKGFTLIELLVVIAIIGILATIVLVSLNSARNKAYDTSIKTAIEQSRNVAEMIYDDTSTYAGLCDAANSLNAAQVNYGTQLGAIETKVDADNAGLGAVPSCYASANAYCVQGSLRSAGSWCVDSKGNNGSVSVLCAAGNIECD